jgi:hypothetical protein
MGVAQRMGGLVVAPVRRPPVVDGHPVEPWQDPGVVHRRSAPPGMHAEPAQPRIRRRMDPVQPARHPRAALVKVRDLSPGQQRADPLGEPAQPRRALRGDRGQRPGGHRRAQHLPKQLRGPLHRQVLAHRQVAGQPADPRAVAGRRAGLWGKPGGRHRPAVASAPLGPMLDGSQADLGQVQHLPGLHPDHRRQHQQGAAPSAPLGRVDNDLVRVLHPGQVRARGAGPLARPTRAGVPLPRGSGRLAQPITRRWPGGVGRIPAELTLQLRDPCLESRDDRPQLRDDRCLGSHGRLQIQLGRRDRGLRQVERHARLPIRRRSTSNATTASGSTQLSMLWVSVRTGPAGAPSAGSRLLLLGAAMTSTMAPGADNGARPLHDPLSGGRSFSLRMH